MSFCGWEDADYNGFGHRNTGDHVEIHDFVNSLKTAQPQPKPLHVKKARKKAHPSPTGTQLAR